ncbi:hypothetical protein [Homoserinimonas sp. OAct 916]|uniref:hypothetical protein n=1 Tax=Homoserinimonas sp. OAct 916 TaxID=2211450 RepID=UPI000DBE1202|nr:hypothetical protein [Homoserinimonas sp. OAct 916]
MFLSILFTIKQLLPPLEVALTFGILLFALSWIRPRRIVSLPKTGQRRMVLAWTGIVGSLLVVLVATIVSMIAVASHTYPTSGFDGWWRRPAPLFIATVVVVVAALVLRRTPLPAPGERAIVPRRPWHAFVSKALLWISGLTAGLLAVTALWQVVIATSAPEDGRFLGIVPIYTDLPIYMTFNSGYGYIAGAGWPNHLATLVALAFACVIFVVVLRADANQPLFARSSAASVRTERELTARLFTFILLGGLITTLGAVWMHTGSIGQALVGLDQQWDLNDPSAPRIYVGSGYDAIARPMNLMGYLLQATGVAFLLRLAVDTARAAFGVRRSPATAPDHEPSTSGARR